MPGISGIPSGLVQTPLLDSAGKMVRAWVLWFNQAVNALSSPVLGNGAANTAVKTTLKGTGPGPANPQTIVGYVPSNFNGEIVWFPVVK